jgi:hypothetical protein
MGWNDSRQGRKTDSGNGRLEGLLDDQQTTDDRLQNVEKDTVFAAPIDVIGTCVVLLKKTKKTLFSIL